MHPTGMHFFNVVKHRENLCNTGKTGNFILVRMWPRCNIPETLAQHAIWNLIVITFKGEFKFIELGHVELLL